jgi:sugar lactone lactonase YvrE
MLTATVRTFPLAGLLTRALVLAAFVAVTGCAQSGTAKKMDVFWPPPPNLPRLQYLTAISSSTDIEGKKSSFSLVALAGDDKESVKGIVKPYGVAVRGGKLYACDTIAARVIVIDFAAKTFNYLKGNLGEGKLKKPIAVTVDEAGTIYVLDTLRKEVLAYTPDGEYMGALGKDLNLQRPTGIALHEKNLYITDMSSPDLFVVDRVTGQQVGSIGASTAGADNALLLPMNVTVDKKGFIYAITMGDGKIFKFDRDGHLLLSFGKMGDGFGQFSRPRGLVVDDQGKIYAIDAAHQNVQVFNEEGKLLTFFGDPSPQPGSLNLPGGIALSPPIDFFGKYVNSAFEVEQLIFVTSQLGDDKINVYALGKKRGVDYEKEYERIRRERQEKAQKFLEEQRKKAEEEKAPEKTPEQGAPRQEGTVPDGQAKPEKSQ